MKRRAYSGQATLEVTVALILIMLLIVGSIKIFLWLNERMVFKQEAYEGTRVSAGSAPSAGVALTSLDNVTPAQTVLGDEGWADESAYPKLNIFGQSN